MSVSSNLLAANVSGIETDTSGWTAGANTSLSWSTRWYTGSHSLQMTATAVGSVTATTAARVAVTAGSVYTAYAYFAGITATSGRTATVSVSWYSAATGGTAISTATSSAITLPNSTGWATPPPILIATAPSGATYAAVTITVAGLAASGAVAADAIAFGPPNLISGNYLDYNTQGVEVDTSGWSATTNATIATSSTASYEGWKSLQITATTTGDTQVQTVNTYSVTAGVEQYAFTYIYAPAANLEFRVELWWYDSTGTLLSSASQSWYPAASTWTRCAVIATPPTGATSGRLVLRPQATAAGQAWLCDQMAFLLPLTLAGNLIGFNDQDFEVSLGHWSAAQGCSIARTTSQAFYCVASMQITADGTADPLVNLSTQVAVTPRQAYRIMPHIYLPATQTTTVADIIFTWWDSTGTAIVVYYSRWNLLASSSGGWYTLAASAVAPAGAVTLTAGIRFPGAASGAVFTVDTVGITQGGLGILADPIDGKYGARISLQGLTADGYNTYGLWRMLPDGSTTALRGSSGDLSQVSITGDTAVVEDYEAPLGVPLLYYVKVWSPPGSTSNDESTQPLTLAEPDDTEIVVKDPLLPARWTSSIVATMPDWQRQARQGVNQVRGRTRPIVVSDVRQTRTGTLALVTETEEDRDALWWVLDTGNTVLLQWPSSAHEADMYAQIGDVAEAHVVPNSQYADRTWTLALIEVDRPYGGIVGSASRTWNDVLTGNNSWSDVSNGSTSWLDVLTGVKGG